MKLLVLLSALFVQGAVTEESSAAAKDKRAEARKRIQEKIERLIDAADDEYLNKIEQFVDKLRAMPTAKSVGVSRPYIGFYNAPLDDDELEELSNRGIAGGVKVGQIIPGSPAEKYGLKPGDILLSALNEGNPLHSVQQPRREKAALASFGDLVKFLTEQCKPGDSVEFSVLRDGGIIDVRVVLSQVQEAPNMRVETDEDTPFMFDDVPADVHKMQKRLDELTKLNELLRNTIKQLEIRIAELQGKAVKDQKAGRPYIGIKVSEADEDDKLRLMDFQCESGIKIVSVEKGSPAEKAGLKQGDIIIEINNKGVGTYEDMEAILKTIKPGDSLNVRVVTGRLNDDNKPSIVLYTVTAEMKK